MMLNAVVSVWNEEDIIESTVRHAFAQGCDNVYLIDNASTDDTVKIAEKAGATLACKYKTQYFDEIKKILHINSVVRIVNKESNQDFVWWMFLDADEFHDTNTELTASQYLKNLDKSYSAVTGYHYNHLPTHYPYNISGYHPSDFMPLCIKTTTQKVSLLRYDTSQGHIAINGGAHSFSSPYDIKIKENSIFLHHYPHRNPQNTYKRLKLLCENNPDGTARVDWMDMYAQKYLNKESSMYHERLKNLKSHYAKYNGQHLTNPELEYSYANIKRWYSHTSKETYTWSNEFEYKMAVGIHFYYLQDYVSAVCLFNDAIEVAKNKDDLIWCTIKLGECFLCLKDEIGENILVKVREKANDDAKEYINKLINVV